MSTELHNFFEGMTQFTHGYCGCIRRGDGQQLRYCGRHNTKHGTKLYTKRISVTRGRGNL